MATGINFSETITPSNIIFEPVVNKSEGIKAESNLNTVSTLLKVGAAGAIDYAKYKTEEEARKQVEKTIEDYDQFSPSKIVENQNIANNLQEKITNPETNPVEVPGFINSLTEVNRKLIIAHDQGRITPLEFEARVSKHTAELAARNPVFAPEIYKAAQLALESANMSTRLKFDNKIIEDARQDKKDRETRLENDSRALKLDITYFPGTYIKDYDTFEKTVNDYLRNEKNYNETVRHKDKLSLLDETNIRNLNDNGTIPGIVAYKVQNTYSKAIDEINNVKNIAELPFVITKVFKDAQFELKELFSSQINNPIIKGHLDSFDKRTDSMIASLTNKKTGKDMADSLKQTKETLEIAQQLEILKEINLPELKVLEIFEEAYKNIRDPGTKEKILKLMNWHTERILKNPVLYKDIIKSTNGIPSIHTTATTTTIKAAETDTTLYPVIKQFLQLGTDATKREDSNLTERTQALENLMIIYADPKSKEISKMTDPKMKADQNKTIESYIAYAIQGIKQENTRFRDSSVVVKNKLFIDGTMYAEGGDDKYQSIVVNKVNTALKAYANFYGKDTKDIAQEFYQKYFSGVFVNQGPQSPGNITPIEQGNIDLKNRPVVKNSDGSISTVRSMSFYDGEYEVLIPTVSDDGKIMSDREAIKQYYTTDQHLGKFKTIEEATAYAKSLSEEQAKLYAPDTNTNAPSPSPGDGTNKKDMSQSDNPVDKKLSSTSFNNLTPVQKDDLLKMQEEAEGTLIPGSIAARHNNPGAMVYASWQKAFGGIKGETIKGEDGVTRTFAKFPILQQGRRAQKELWIKQYGDIPLSEALLKWVAPKNPKDQSFIIYKKKIADVF